MFLPSNITLKFGDSGDFVAELQRRLAIVKCFSDDQVNGFYDGATVNGVMAFQGMNGLHADGVAGPETLRRLNGVIAGDTSGSGEEDKKEEEVQKAVSDHIGIVAMLDQQPQPAAWGEPAPREETSAAPAAPALQPAGLDPAMFAPAVAPAMIEAERAEMLRQRPSEPAIELTEMLLSANAQQQIQQRDLQQQAALDAAPPQAMQPPPQPVQQAAPAVPPAPPMVEPAQQPLTAAPAVAEPQGLVQRAGRFANAMMQKLADYFEAKLPPSVLNEVKSAGQVMAAAGLREAPIPTGPEMGGPAQQLPARGPEQQPAQVR